MTARVVPFPLRARLAAILVVPELGGGGWLALCGSHGWLFSAREAAIAEAKWLSCNCGLPVREIAP
jgi:hypothetical protein